MAFEIITGVPGTGKTLYAIQKYIIPALKNDVIVYTNIDNLIKRRLAGYFGIDLQVVEKNLRKIEEPKYFYKNVPKNAFIVLDEAQNHFKNRDWQKQENIDLSNYLMEYRHHGHDLLMLTPSVDSLDASIRRVADLTYKCKSFSIIGNSKTVRTSVHDQAYIQKEPLRVFKWKHDERIYECYSSYFEEGTKENKVKVNIFKNTKLILIGVLVVIMCIWSIKGFKSFNKKLNPDSIKKIKEKEEVQKKSKVKNVIKVNGKDIYK